MKNFFFRYKLQVAEDVITHLAPIRLEITKLLSNPEFLMHILQDGANRATEIASKTMLQIQTGLGLRYNVKNTKLRKIDIS